MAEINEIFKNFREYSVAEFFRKNRQMLGYVGKVRSMTTIIHEYVTNSLDACEEAEKLPEIYVEINELDEETYRIRVKDNGPGIPKELVGKALGSILAGTKFHRYVQQRGQQGIGAAGCTLYSQLTTGKPVHVRSVFSDGRGYECDIAINVKNNTPIVTNLVDINDSPENAGFEVTGYFKEIKYESSERGPLEYLKRTALANPHATIHFIGPDGNRIDFIRSLNEIPQRPKEAKPHPLGITTVDLYELAQSSQSKKISSFLKESLSRVTDNKIEEISKLVDIDLNKSPKDLSWEEAERLVKAMKSIKWIAPDASSIIPIGQRQMEIAVKNIINPEFVNVVERKPKIYHGGIPFITEVAIAFGGDAGKKTELGVTGSLIRFANKVPLLFEAGSCAITQAVNSIDWSRYDIDFENDPITVVVNISSVFIPYTGVGKEAIAPEEEILDEVKLAVMESLRGLQIYVSNKKKKELEINKFKTIMRYADQVASDLSYISGNPKELISSKIKELVLKRYPGAAESNDIKAKESNKEDQESTSSG
ncbi:MAG: DNA topoisomerase VI subunit B [Candidatus Micrarchaeota archaeon]|nr:MAG: DNA topoisomerase VI subunit B [Candidatus Micrarchaeota archaeon]